MKVCNTEIMKRIKVLNEQKAELLVFEEENSRVRYLNTETKQDSEYDFNDVTNKLISLDNEIIHLKEVLANSNNITMVNEFNMSVSSALIYLTLLNERKNRYSRLANKRKLTRIGVMADSSIEYEETLYEPKTCREEVSKLTEEINKLQMAIDRANLTNEVEI